MAEPFGTLLSEMKIRWNVRRYRKVRREFTESEISTLPNGGDGGSLVLIDRDRRIMYYDDTAWRCHSSSKTIPHCTASIPPFKKK